MMTPGDLRRAAISRTLLIPCSLQDAIQRLGYVQADPIRAPSRSQDLIVRHRAQGYVVGELESLDPRAPISGKLAS